MQARVTHELRVERSDEDRALTADDRHRVSSRGGNGGEDLDAGPGPFDQRGPDEDSVEWVVDTDDVEIGLERIDLATEGVAPDANVDGGEPALVRPPVAHVDGEQDHSGAGAEGRHPRRQPVPERIDEPRRLQEHRHGRRLAPGDDQRLHLVELGWGAHLDPADAEAGEDGEMVADVALQGEHADRDARRVVTVGCAVRTMALHLAAPCYQPRSARRVSTWPASSPRMASPRPRLTLATICGSR